MTKIQDAIYGFIVGDAIGVPYEFKKRGSFQCADMRASGPQDTHFVLPLGAWSDDTSLMLCVLDALAVKRKADKQKLPSITPEQYKIPEYARIWDGSIMDAPMEEVNSSGFVVDTLEASLWCCAQNGTYKDAVLAAVNLGDDTDTVAALTGFLSGICFGDVPEEWVNNIRKKRTVKKLMRPFR